MFLIFPLHFHHNILFYAPITVPLPLQNNLTLYNLITLDLLKLIISFGFCDLLPCVKVLFIRENYLKVVVLEVVEDYERGFFGGDVLGGRVGGWEEGGGVG